LKVLILFRNSRKQTHVAHVDEIVVFSRTVLVDETMLGKSIEVARGGRAAIKGLKPVIARACP
jgi:hypothetical protein